MCMAGDPKTGVSYFVCCFRVKVFRPVIDCVGASGRENLEGLSLIRGDVDSGAVPPLGGLELTLMLNPK